jgi:hypothetical protein
MKNVFETVAKWFSSPQSGSVQDLEAAALPEHERRMLELEKSGRKQFLP